MAIILRRPDEDEDEVPSRLRPIEDDEVPAAVGITPAAVSSSSRPAETRLQPLSYQERHRLPTVSPGAPAGSAAFYENQVERLEDEKANPWGSPENHPGRLGRLAHVLARAGNIAGDVLAPARMAMIPGSDENRAVREAEAEKNLGAAETRESEGRLRSAQATNLESEATARQNPGKTADEQALAARARILAVPKGQEPDPKDVSTWQAFADLEQTKKTATPTDETKQPVGEAGVTQHGKELETLTSGMTPQDRKKFLDAYTVTASDTHAIATKRLEDAKASAQLSAGERDRALQRDIANRNHEDEQARRGTEMSSEIVRAIDKAGKVHLLSRGDYEARKDEFNPNPMKMNEGALTKATDHATVINEMQARTNALAEAVEKMNWEDKGQLNIVKQALAHVNHSYADDVIGIPITKFIADNLKQLGLEGATPQTRKYIVSLLSLREAALGLPKEITGGSRTSDIAANALWETLPTGATPNSEWAFEHLRAFQSTVDRLKESRVPSVPGLPDVRKDRTLYQHHYSSKKGEIFSDDGKNWVDANGDPVGR